MGNFKEKIKAEAERLGFSFIGFSPIKQTPHFKSYIKWLDQSMSGEMHYLTREHIIAQRKNPKLLLENVQTAIVVGLGYSPGRQFDSDDEHVKFPTAKIAAYAQHQDYHVSIREKCEALIAYTLNFSAKGLLPKKIFIDSAAVMEKDFAYQAGLGSIGKNSLLINPTTGSYCLLGCIFTLLEFEPDELSFDDICGDCRRCINACPTQCINEDRTVDARKCISYLTIEHKGGIAYDLREKMGSWIFGCDVCQQVCPMNDVVHNKISHDLKGLQKLLPEQFLYSDMLALSPETFISKFKNTPVKRVTYENFMRNVIIAAANSKLNECEKTFGDLLLNHPSEIIRIYAAWAVGRIETKPSRKLLDKALHLDQNPTVRQEIIQILEN